MPISVLPAAELTPDLVARWSALQQGNPVLVSPYFRPEFTAAVASVRPGVFVAVIDDGAAFFPFQRERFGIGRPVGAPLSDYHGLIAAPDFQFDALKLVGALGLQVWDFDHLPAEQAAFRPWLRREVESPQIDLRQPDAVGSAKLREQVENRRRKIAREIGPLEFEFRSLDQDAYQSCMRWKVGQYHRTGVPDVLATPWVSSLLRKIGEQDSEQFSGVLSVLRAGGRIVAAHFGMRSGHLLHYWFPSYDIDLSVYSPGNMLLLAIIDAAAEQGISVIDLGKGDQFYKGRLANAAAPLLEGCVATGNLIPLLRTGRKTIRSWVRATPLRGPVYAVLNRLRGR